MNGYSPYMEHVFVSRRHPLPAPADGITADELRELSLYARRFHVTLIPEQQTFAHMHNTLRWERYAPMAELPHGYLLSPAVPQTYDYVGDLLREELAAVPRPPYFHIGSDEPLDLGRGRSRAQATAHGDAWLYTWHVRRVAQMLTGSSANPATRPMIWDDAIGRAPWILPHLPKSLVIVNWHYGAEPSYQPYIDRIANAGFDQLVAPGANNWNEIFPDIDVALPNENRFISQGKSSHVLGLFQTVWHDDGETLYEATWYPVLYAGVSAWEHPVVTSARYARDFPWAFYGTDDQRYAVDVAALARARALLRSPDGEDSGDYLFWVDPYTEKVEARIVAAVNLSAVRNSVEPVIEHLRFAPPPLHANAASVMALAARRYDLLARKFQIAHEARIYYEDAHEHADGSHNGIVYRSLYVVKYLFWELRDDYLELEPLYRIAWEYESRPDHELSAIERYHLAAQKAIARADRINVVTREIYIRTHHLPSFDEAIGR
jgi:hypothetical protein